MEKPEIVLTDRKKGPPDTRCPQCRAEKGKRRLSGGFGELHDICGVCGHDFPERTIQ